MIFLSYAAPFATFRDLGANYRRSSFGFTPPSALYGLLLSLAGVEMRDAPPSRLPRFRLASAARRLPQVVVLYQQLHTIPVGSAGSERIPETKGTKHFVIPGEREILHDVAGFVGIDAGAELEERIRLGLERPAEYGLPFLGDNNFFLSELSLVEPTGEPVRWLVRRFGEPPGRLTVWCDRAGALQTRAAEFGYEPGSEDGPPPLAWVEVGPL